jgi:hypothetical protein
VEELVVGNSKLNSGLCEFFSLSFKLPVPLLDLLEGGMELLPEGGEDLSGG